jgi:hypothetical protein
VKITNGRGYIDVKVKFPGSGQVRLAYAVPGIAQLANPLGSPSFMFSRTTNIAVR